MQNPLISILTPFKNTTEFLAECLESIQNQTYSHWELLIIDDSSTDKSYQLVTDFAEQDKRIKLFKNPGEGILPALQFDIKIRSDTYITHMIIVDDNN